MAKKFFYVCAGIFLLALSYHFGASTATAQAPGNPAVSGWSDGSGGNYVLASSGDLYRLGYGATVWVYVTNVFSGHPVNARTTTFGQVKVGDR